MSCEQAEELLTWGYGELDVSKANCSIRAASFFLDEDAWMMLNLYDRSSLPCSFSCLSLAFIDYTSDIRIMRQVAMNRRYRQPPAHPPVLHVPEVQTALFEANAAYESGEVVTGSTQHTSPKR